MTEIILLVAAFFFTLGWMACLLWYIGKKLKDIRKELPPPKERKKEGE